MKRRVLVIDNYDSFVYNLVQYIGELGEEVIVKRNDSIDIAGVEEIDPNAIVISPGPCTPVEAGISVAAIRRFGQTVPILGICLGHQSICQAFGGRLVRLDPPVHGKASAIHHDGLSIFDGIETPLIATRYHSLIIDELTLPGCLKVSARIEDGTIMGVRHVSAPIEGVQFHPESILTPSGMMIIANFLRLIEAANP